MDENWDPNEEKSEGVQARERQWKETANQTYQDYHQACPGSNAEAAATGTKDQGSPTVIKCEEKPDKHSHDVSATSNEHHQPHDVSGSVKDSPASRARDSRRETCRIKHPENMQQVVFHVHLDDAADKVSVAFEKPLISRSDLMLDLHRVGDNHKYWTSTPIHVSPEEYEAVKYRYFVKYHQGVIGRVASGVRYLFGHEAESVKKETKFRSLFPWIDQYDIFKPEASSCTIESIFEGQFFFVNMLYNQIGLSELSFKDLMMRCEHVGFGHQSYRYQDKMTFSKWIEKVTSDGVTPYQSAFLCSLLGQFLKKAGYTINIRYMFQESLKTVDILLANLRNCPIYALPRSSLQIIKNIDMYLLEASSTPNGLGYILNFGHIFNSWDTLDAANSLGNTYLEKDFDSLSRAIVQSLDMVKNREDRNNISIFLTTMTPSIGSLWKLYRHFENHLPDQLIHITDTFVKTFRGFFKWSRKPNVLNTNVWDEVPESLSPSLAGSFFDAVMEQVKKVGALKTEELCTVKIFLLNKDLQHSSKLAIVKLVKWLTNSKRKDYLEAVSEVLEAHNFQEFWQRLKDEDKEGIASGLLDSKMRASGNGKSNKEKVLAHFRVFQEVCETRVLKTEEELISLLGRCICQSTQCLGLRAIVDAYGDILDVMPQLSKVWFMKLLQNTLETESARGDLRSRLIGIIQTMGESKTTSIQQCHIDRGREELLIILLHQTKLPIPQSQNYENSAKKILQAVLSERETWKLMLRATGAVSRLRKNPKFIYVSEALAWLSRSTVEQKLRVGFFKDLEVNEVAEVLALTDCDPTSIESSNYSTEKRWQLCISSFVAESRNLDKDFAKLENVITLVQKSTGEDEIIKLEDMDMVLKELNNRRKNLKDTVLAETRLEKYWGPLNSFLGLAETLCRYHCSTLFSNVAIKCAKALKQQKQELDGQIDDEGEWTDIDDDVDQETEKGITGNITTATVGEVLQFLSDQGIREFINTCDLFFKTDGEIAVDELDSLFYGVNKDELEKELKLVSTLLGHGDFPPTVKRMLNNYLKYPEVQNKIQKLVSALDKVGYDATAESPMLESLLSFVKCTETPTTLKNLSEAIIQKTIADVDEKLDPDLTDILSELAEARELIDFITKTANDDMVDLVDAVEEHSDQLIQEATVSYLIDVHRFLSGLLKDKPDDPISFFVDLVKTYKALDESRKTGNSRKTKMAAKIKLCSSNVHSLRGLYMTLANRGEMTKEIIENAVKYGCYQVEITPDKSCQVLLTYDRKDSSGTKASYGMAELHDLRSRALLIVNSEKTKDSGSLEKERAIVTSDELSTFIQQVDLITEIIRKYEVLRSSGLPEYQACWKKLQTTEEIKDLERSLDEELECWNTILHRVRMKHFYLNYFHANQLWTLKKFFREHNNLEEEDRHVAFGMFRSIDPRIQLGDLPYFLAEYRPPKNNDKESELHAIGQALEEIFKSKNHAKHPLISTKQIDATVEPGKLFVAVLEPKSAQTVHVIMSLFQNTSASLPEPSQVLFCHSGTTWEEIELLLRRTFEAHVHGNTSKLHCLANVESLPNDIQFELVDTIKKFQSSNEATYRLALVCRGGAHHHIVDQFSDFAHHSGGMADAELRDKFAEARPNVLLITADLPGLGKTETIHDHAAAKRKRVVTFPINGPVSRRTLVRRLSTLKLKRYQVIHFEIGEVDDPLALDTFLFELIVIGMVLSGTELFHLPTEHIYIEVANTLQHWMRDSLPVTKCFKRLGKKWENYKDLVISQEVTSPIQVVCHYLQAYERGTLENEEVIFSGSNKVKPLSFERCRSLLLKHFATGGDPSFNILENFLYVLADQLLKFTRSQFFKPHNLEAMVGKSHDVRVRLFKALLEVATSFAARSVNTCKAIQAEALNEEQTRDAIKKMQSMQAGATAHQMVSRVNEMIQWADNESIVIVFHGLGSITAIYRDLDKVPQGVKDLFKSQAIKGKGQGLDDYKVMSQIELQIRLERISDVSKKPSGDALSMMGYALTPDNILKMALITQRMQANIPVIVMGETGCGKTTLVRYLAVTRNTPFHVFNFHAGITEEQIIEFILLKDKEARGVQKEGKAVWVFLDEINTCDYLGTVNEIICHRSVHGTPLTSNLVFVAACNPYRLRPPGKVMTAGLIGKVTTDEYSKLVYRVHPLPETMIDYVWDYGSLSPEDERTYISRMVEGVWDKKYEKLLVALLAASQDFVRETEGSSYCVSLRDVHRSIILMKWFHKMLKKRPSIPCKIPNHLRRYFETAAWFSFDERSVVLSLAHCYLSRLPTTKLRDGYCKKMTSIFTVHKLVKFVDQKAFQEIIRAEQEDYLLRMELPEGTACNAALRENVFVILVCILNRIPVFVVGKPGCSKSLSMQVIRSNLRGQDSKDPFLKTLPQLFVVSYQGSESSTSEGIEKVFEKAMKYKEKTHNVLPVVLLDEIGLAEVSKFNPLKVLHRLLEPGKGEFPDVAVVGISNWALDAAKMNRAIHLSRPEPDENDLYETGLSIRQVQINKVEGAKRTRSVKEYGKYTLADQQLKSLAQAYYQYQSSQKHENFHGLRDYYSMVKCLDVSTKDKGKSGEIQRALQRNFGGLTRGASTIQQLFLEKLEKYQAAEESREFLVTDLIRDNLHDKLARHLMLLTNSDSAIGILDQTLEGLNKEKITIFGSRFEEDLSADYNYRVLSRIILCMEQDCVLILRDLENIYGSLYDMLNQNYIVVGGKKNCRIALGAFSNPMCQVHDGFRCIVLVDQSKVDYTDPPFLNRFEKQLLRFSDVLNAEQQVIIKELRDWAESISTLEEHGVEFDEKDMFAGFHDDTLPSLVLNHSQDSDLSSEDVLKRCKEDLMAVASPDAVLRSLKSNLHHSNDEEVKHLYDEYFQRPVHQGLEHFLHHSFKSSDALGNESCGMKILVMTHSNIHTNISKDLASHLEVQTEKLSSFKSEKQLSKRMQHFWLESNASLLVVQCQPNHDSSHILLAKSIIEQQRTEFLKRSQSGSAVGPKHVCIVIHLQHERPNENERYSSRWQFNFLGGWQQVMIDVLERQVVPITDLLEVGVLEVLHSHTHPFQKVAADQLLWCFTRIKYPPSRQPSLKTIMALVDCLSKSQTIMECFEQLCYQWIRCKQEDSNSSTSGIFESWQVSVACDRQALVNCSTLVRALEHFVYHLVRQPLAKIIYFMENESAWGTCQDGGEDELRTLMELMLNERVFNIDQIPDPQGAESLVARGTNVVLKYPFASLFCQRIECVSDFFMQEFRRQHLIENNLDKNGELTTFARESLMKRVSSVVEQRVPEIIESEFLSSNIDHYVEDVLDMKSEEFSDVLNRCQRVSLLKASLLEIMPTSDVKNDVKDVSLIVTRLHSAFWIAGNSVVPILQFVSTCHNIAPVELCEIITTFYCMAEKEKSKNEDKQDTLIEGVNDVSGESDVETSNKMVSNEELLANYDNIKNRLPDKAELVEVEELEVHVLETAGGMDEHADIVVPETDERLFETAASRGSTEEIHAISPEHEEVIEETKEDADFNQTAMKHTMTLQTGKEMMKSSSRENKDNSCCTEIAKAWAIHEIEDLPHSTEAGKVVTTMEEKAPCEVTESGQKDDGADGKTWSENEETSDPVCEIDDKHVEEEDESLTLAMPTKESSFTEDPDTGPESEAMEEEQESIKESMENVSNIESQTENEIEDNNDKLEQSESDVEENSPGEEEMEISGSGDHEEEELNDDQSQTECLQESCPTFDEYLVQEFCSAMIPTEELVSTMGGPDKWLSAAGLILSMASRMPSRDPVFYYLRVCYDFTSLVLLPESLKPCFLYLFGELGKQVAEEDYLDSTRCFETFCETVEDLRGEVKDENRLTEFLYLLFARCIDSNPDTPSLGGILKQISSSEDERLLRLACPILFRVLLSEEHAFTHENFGKILRSASELDDFPNLLEIKEVLSPFEEENVKELVPHFLVMCCDLINEVAFKDLSVTGLSGSDSPELKNYHRAMDILTDTTEDNDHDLFVVVCAIAYVRAFMIAFVSFLQDHPRSLSTDGEYSMLMNDISGALNPGGRRERQVCCFLLKELRNKLSMFEIQSMCEQSEKLQVLKELKWQERHSTAKLSLDPFLKLQQKSEAEHALGNLLSNENPQPMQKVLCSLDSSQTRVELAAVLMKVFYLTRSIRNIKDTEDAAAVVLKDNIKNVSKPYVEFILRIVNQNKFGSPKLDISPESSPMDVQIAALMLHLTAILTSSYSDKNPSALMCCLTDPAKLSTSHIFAAPENAKSGFGIYTNFDVVNRPRVSRLRCSCGTTLAVLMEEVLDLVCPNCKRALDVYCLQHEDPAEPPKAACAVGYLPCDPQEMLDDLICVRNLRPAEFRILHLAVHCALFMGHAMQLTDDNTLAKFLSQEKKIEDPSELCYQHVRHDLNVISRLFDCREELALNLLHSVFESTTSLLTEDLKMALPHDQTARCSWEENFATVLSPLIMKFQHNEIKPSLKGQNNVQCLEDQIDEVGEPHYLDVDASNLQIPRLFRKTKPKSFTGLRSYYLNSPAAVKEKHQLLGLFLDYHNKLPLAGNLVALNTWSRLVDFLLSRRLTRREAKEKKIADAIIRREEHSMQTFPGNVNKVNLGKMFEDFRKAWETILPHVQEQLEDGDTMPYISEMNSVGYCLVETRELGRYLASALTFLARIQNEFLDKVLAIAATGNSPAVDFLHKGDSISVLPVVHLQDARDKEIVQYEWTDLFLVHSQHNTEYGHGTEIIYDLGKIEKEMAVKFIMGKSYLAVSEGLKEFVFSKQLFHDCADILNELQLAVPQEQLPNDVERGMLSLAEKSLGNIQTLLENMEIVLCFLKRTGGKKDDSLVDFIDSWVSASQHFSKELLPEPQDAIKLKHVAALYESLEDKLSASAAECVSDEYREPLSDDSKRLIDESDVLKSKQGKQIILEATVVALTRFIFRYLCLKPEPGNDLLECMKDPSLWPIGLVGGTKSSKFQVSVIVPQLIPKMLTIGHVHSVLAHFQDHLKRCFERRGTRRGARAAAAVGPRAQRSQAKKGRRSFGTGLS